MVCFLVIDTRKHNVSFMASKQTHTLFRQPLGPNSGARFAPKAGSQPLFPSRSGRDAGPKTETIFASKNDFILEALLRAGLGGLQQSLSRCGPGLAGGSDPEASVGVWFLGAKNGTVFGAIFGPCFFRFPKKI